MKLLPLILILLVTQVFSKGVFVFKDANHQDDSAAKAAYYTAISTSPLNTWVTIEGRRLGFDSLHFHDWIEIQPALPNELLSKQQILEFRSYAAHVKQFSERFARARPLLKADLDLCTDALAKLDDGEFRVNANWVTKADYDAILTAAKMKEQAWLKKVEDRKREEEQASTTIDMEKKIRWSRRPTPDS